MSAWWTSPLVVGHRGGRGAGWPAENTLAAFEQARAQGARAIELDVRTCAGGTLVVFHDATLARMTGERDPRRVSEVPERELLGIDLGGGATIPTLLAVLTWARQSEVAVNVEMKHGVPGRRALVRATVDAVRATRADVLSAINRYHRADGELDDLTMSLSAADDDLDELTNVKDLVEDAPIVKFVNLLISQAVQDRASDIHIEPTERDLRVRYRIDGVLHEVMKSPKSIQAGVTSRLKIMAEMNIAERRVPQDGRLSVNVTGKKIDLRVASLPTVWGEKIVMRILDNSTALLKLTDLGFSDGNYERWSQSFTKPYGMMLVTGPTGSGKSTTLYATLNIVSTPDKNVITVEDPVEYRIPGINQVQTNVKAGLTFASALRSILRSDPDVVLIGEVRDHETAQIAIEAALTGHLVLTTLHTNNAPSAITRLIEMGIEPFLVGTAVDCVLAQRLARRLCPKCKEAYVPTAEALALARYPMSPDEPLPTLYRPIGCAACSKTGYKGRLALHEVMVVSEAIERLAVEHASAEVIAKVARDEGMVTLRHDGLAKVAAGVTSLEEIFRVVV